MYECYCAILLCEPFSVKPPSLMMRCCRFFVEKFPWVMNTIRFTRDFVYRCLGFDFSSHPTSFIRSSHLSYVPFRFSADSIRVFTNKINFSFWFCFIFLACLAYREHSLECLIDCFQQHTAPCACFAKRILDSNHLIYLATKSEWWVYRKVKVTKHSPRTIHPTVIWITSNWIIFQISPILATLFVIPFIIINMQPSQSAPNEMHIEEKSLAKNKLAKIYGIRMFVGWNRADR